MVPLLLDAVHKGRLTMQVKRQQHNLKQLSIFFFQISSLAKSINDNPIKCSQDIPRPKCKSMKS